MPRSIAQQMARATGIFQALVALPAMVVLAGWAMVALFETSMSIYEFVASTFNALFAAGIIFIVFVQHNTNTSLTVTLYFELAKSGLATAMWLWLILDCAAGPDHWNGYQRYPRGPRIVRAAISAIVLFILYYPTLIYAKYEKNLLRDGNAGVDPEASASQHAEQAEREPLLG